MHLVTLTTPGHDRAEQVPVTKPNHDVVKRGSQVSLETELNTTAVRDLAEHVPGTELNSEAGGRRDQVSHGTELNTNTWMDRAEQRPGTEPNSEVGGREDQVSKETEPNTSTVSVPEATAGGQTSDRAEQRMTGCPQTSSSYQDTTSVRQCHTRPWPVARYVDLPVNNYIVPSLTSNFGKDQTEQTSRVEQCSTTKKRLKEDDLQVQSLELRDCLNVMTVVNHPSLSIRKSMSNQECSRRQEDPTRKENTNRMEESIKEGSQNPEKSLKTCWKEIRMSRRYLLANFNGWKELDGKDTRRLERMEKKFKSDLIQRKKKKFGKAGNLKITRMEEVLISSNTRKLIELEEIKLNLQQKPALQDGRKMENERQELTGRKFDKKKIDIEAAEHWHILATRLKIIDKNEHWLNAGWLENSSLEEQRCILYASGEKESDKASGDRESLDMESLEEIDKKSGSKVYKLAGLFQRDGKEDRRMVNGREGGTELQGQGGEGGVQVHGGVHRDAQGYCEENFDKYEKKTTTSREEDFDLAEEPQFDRKTSLLGQEDIGDIPASGSVMFGRKEDKLFDTHAEKRVTSLNSGYALGRKMSEMHSPRLASRAHGLTKSEMHCQDRSPGGGGKISKFKRGTPKATSRVNSIRKLFENASPNTTGGTIELLLEANTEVSNFNFNLNPATNKIGTRQKELICVGQPGRGVQTRPREACGLLFRPRPDWPSQPGLGRTSQSDKLSQD